MGDEQKLSVIDTETKTLQNDISGNTENIQASETNLHYRDKLRTPEKAASSEGSLKRSSSKKKGKGLKNVTKTKNESKKNMKSSSSVEEQPACKSNINSNMGLKPSSSSNNIKVELTSMCKTEPPRNVNDLCISSENNGSKSSGRNVKETSSKVDTSSIKSPVGITAAEVISPDDSVDKIDSLSKENLATISSIKINMGDNTSKKNITSKKDLTNKISKKVRSSEASKVKTRLPENKNVNVHTKSNRKKRLSRKASNNNDNPLKEVVKGISPEIDKTVTDSIKTDTTAVCPNISSKNKTSKNSNVKRFSSVKLNMTESPLNTVNDSKGKENNNLYSPDIVAKAGIEFNGDFKVSSLGDRKPDFTYETDLCSKGDRQTSSVTKKHIVCKEDLKCTPSVKSKSYWEILISKSNKKSSESNMPSKSNTKFEDACTSSKSKMKSSESNMSDKSNTKSEDACMSAKTKMKSSESNMSSKSNTKSEDVCMSAKSKMKSSESNMSDKSNTKSEDACMSAKTKMKSSESNMSSKSNTKSEDVCMSAKSKMKSSESNMSDKSNTKSEDACMSAKTKMKSSESNMSSKSKTKSEDTCMSSKTKTKSEDACMSSKSKTKSEDTGVSYKSNTKYIETGISAKSNARKSCKKRINSTDYSERDISSEIDIECQPSRKRNKRNHSSEKDNLSKSDRESLDNSNTKKSSTSNLSSRKRDTSTKSDVKTNFSRKRRHERNSKTDRKGKDDERKSNTSRNILTISNSYDTRNDFNKEQESSSSGKTGNNSFDINFVSDNAKSSSGKKVRSIDNLSETKVSSEDCVTKCNNVRSKIDLKTYLSRQVMKSCKTGVPKDNTNTTFTSELDDTNNSLWEGCISKIYQKSNSLRIHDDLSQTKLKNIFECDQYIENEASDSTCEYAGSPEDPRIRSIDHTNLADGYSNSNWSAPSPQIPLIHTNAKKESFDNTTISSTNEFTNSNRSAPSPQIPLIHTNAKKESFDNTAMSSTNEFTNSNWSAPSPQIPLIHTSAKKELFDNTAMSSTNEFTNSNWSAPSPQIPLIHTSAKKELFDNTAMSSIDELSNSNWSAPSPQIPLIHTSAKKELFDNTAMSSIDELSNSNWSAPSPQIPLLHANLNKESPEYLQQNDSHNDTTNADSQHSSSENRSPFKELPTELSLDAQGFLKWTQYVSTLLISPLMGMICHHNFFFVILIFAKKRFWVDKSSQYSFLFSFP